MFVLFAVMVSNAKFMTTMQVCVDALSTVYSVLCSDKMQVHQVSHEQYLVFRLK